MSKIYDALEIAAKERLVPDSQVVLPKPPAPIDAIETNGFNMEDEMISLYQVITASLPDITNRVVLFVGSISNEGTSTIAQQFAKVCSVRIGKTVLLIDLDRSRPDLHVYANTQLESELDAVFRGDISVDGALSRVEESSLYVMPLFQRTCSSPGLLDSAKRDIFWEALRERFDLIIVDSPPASGFPDAPGVVSLVDGVILVVEAERTRWQVALSVKEKIIKHNGNLLGIVFNKRQFYIPDFIYKRL